MSTTACEKFVRNAWKRELCSNCFKVKGEHIERTAAAIVVKPLHLPDPPKEGILKGRNSSSRIQKKVAFNSSESEVIGFGGEEEFSDDEDDEGDGRRETVATMADEPDTEQDKALQRLTKNNTEYNSNMLMGFTTPVQPLGLGKQLLGKDGAKKTLLVSVSPFGASKQEITNPSNPTDKKAPLPAQPQDPRAINDSGNLPKLADIGIKRSQPLDKNFKYKLNKDASDDKSSNTGLDCVEPGRVHEKIITSTKVSNLLDKAKKKVHNLPVIGDLQHLKLKNLESKLNEANKGIALDIYCIKDNNDDKQPVKISSDESEKIPPEEVMVQFKEVSSLSYVCSLPSKELLPTADTDVFGDVASVNAEEKSLISYSKEITSEDEGECKLDNYEGLLSGEEVTVFSVDSVDRVEVCEEGPAPVAATEEAEVTEDDEPPALPSSPPPSAHPRISFLHHLTTGTLSRASEKPKVPAKPTLIPSAKKPPMMMPLPRAKSPSNESFLDDSGDGASSEEPKLPDAFTDPAKKRPAPQPPQDISPVFPPQLRSSCSSENVLKLSRNGFSTTLHVRSDVSQVLSRRSYSLSEDCLLNSGISDVQGKKKNSRGRFSLRKFLHLGKNNKDGVKESERREYDVVGVGASESSSVHTVHGPRQKPEIIHPVELKLLNVQQDTSATSTTISSQQFKGLDNLSDSSGSEVTSSESAASPDVKKKPLPPPRSLHQDNSERPARPPPPSASCVSPTLHTSRKSATNISYANIGEVRSSMTPNKPARTGSLRESGVAKMAVSLEKDSEEHPRRENWTGSLRGTSKCGNQFNQPEDSGYESFDVSLSATSDSNPSSHTSSMNEENLYECVMQLEGSWKDSNTIPKQTRGYRRVDGCLRSENDNGKVRFLRSTSMPHGAAADVDSDIYTPYSFCGSEMGEEDYEWSPTSGRFQRVSRLKMKIGRSIVHKNLEDNYGAVVIANHEALTQVVQQMHQGPVVPAALRSLVTATNLRWCDFTVLKDHGSVTVGQRTLYPALWGLEPVTVCLAPEESAGSLHGKPPFSLQPLTQLHDLVAANFVCPGNTRDTSLVQCSISVLNRMQVESLQNYCRSVVAPPLSEDTQKEIYFILLLIVNALKTQQASGIEEVPVGMTNVLVCREERDPHPRICLLPEQSEPTISLCGSLLELLNCLPALELTPLLETTLRAEKAVSLSHAKALLEFTLWGPADISFEKRSRGAALQRWLDLERASVLHGLVRTRTDLSVFEEWHLLFLAHTNAKILNDASDLLGSFTN